MTPGIAQTLYTTTPLRTALRVISLADKDYTALFNCKAGKNVPSDFGLSGDVQENLNDMYRMINVDRTANRQVPGRQINDSVCCLRGKDTFTADMIPRLSSTEQFLMMASAGLTQSECGHHTDNASEMKAGFSFSTHRSR